MKNKARIAVMAVLLVVMGLSFYRLDYYVTKPGGTYNVHDFISIQNGDEDDEGSFHMTTVAMAQATPITYLLAKVQDYYDIVKISDVRQEEDSDGWRHRDHLRCKSRFPPVFPDILRYASHARSVHEPRNFWLPRQGQQVPPTFLPCETVYLDRLPHIKNTDPVFRRHNSRFHNKQTGLRNSHKESGDILVRDRHRGTGFINFSGNWLL